MEFINITEDRILVMVAPAEQGDCEELLCDIVEELIRQDFCTSSDCLFCEIYCSEEECHVFVTRSPHTASKEENVTLFTESGSLPDSFGRTKRQREKEKYIYEFDDFEALLSACLALSRSPSGDVSLLEADGRVYLKLDADSPILGEFSGRRLTLADAARAEDRCRVVKGDAAALGALAL